MKTTPEQLEAYGDTGVLDPEKVVKLWGCLFAGKSFLEANQLMDSLQFEPLVEPQPPVPLNSGDLLGCGTGWKALTT